MLRFGTSFVFLLAVVALLFTRFGTSVPEPAPTPIDSQLLVQKIVKSIHCEISNAITYVIDSDKALAVAFNNGARTAGWLDKWGVDVVLTLSIEDKVSVSPLAISASSDNTRTDTSKY
jgi:hypothetical protein